MKIMLKSWLSLILVAGCGTTPMPPGTTDGAASQPDGVQSGDTSTRKPTCGPYDDGVYGKKHPWSGFTESGTTYTCNACRGGSPSDSGMWRLVDSTTKSPATSMGDFRETVTFDGNIWHAHMQGDDAGKQVDATIAGWFWCADPAELPSGDVVFIADTAAPEGAFGWKSGTVFSGTIASTGNDLRTLDLFTGFETGDRHAYTYCRVGSTIGGVPCTDPFEK